MSSATSTPGGVQASTTCRGVGDVLLGGFGSFFPDDTVALFTSVAGVAGARTVSVTVAREPRPIVPSLHVTAVVPEHLPSVVATETNVAWEGRVSTSVAPVAPSGPLFETDSW